MAKVEIIQQKGYNFLWIDDDVWMWDIPQEQIAQQRISEEAYGNVLVAGYGLGILQRQLTQNPNITSLTTIEILPEIIAANQEAYGKVYGDIIIGDFYDFSTSNQYDCVIGDVWMDIEPEALAEYHKFEDHARTLAKADGKILAWGQDFFYGLDMYYKNKAAK